MADGTPDLAAHLARRCHARIAGAAHDDGDGGDPGPSAAVPGGIVGPSVVPRRPGAGWSTDDGSLATGTGAGSAQCTARYAIWRGRRIAYRAVHCADPAP